MSVTTEIEQMTSFFEVKLNGNLLSPEQMLDISAVTYSDEINTPAMFELHVNLGHGETQEWKYIDSDLYKEGGEIKLKIGYGDIAQEMMTGEITGIEPEFTEEKILIMIVRGYDRLHRLCRGQMTRTFKKMKDSQLVAQIAQENGLSSKVEDTKITYPYLLQNNISNLDFLLQRAQKIGYEFSVNGKNLTLRKSVENSSEVAEINFGQMERTLLEFYPRLSTAFQLAEVEGRYWDLKAKKEVVSTAKVGAEKTKMGGKSSGASITETAFGKSKTIIGNIEMMSQAEAENIAKASYNNHALLYITGEGVCQGNPNVKAGTVVKLSGLGKRFSGLYYITASTHTIDDRGYLTSFFVRRNAA